MLFWHSMSIAQQLIPIYNTIVHKNKNNCYHNVRNLSEGVVGFTVCAYDPYKEHALAT